MKALQIGLLLFISSVLYAQEGIKNFIDQNYIEVTGKSEMEIVPDKIYLKILLNEKDTKNKISVSELEKLMIQKFQDIGIDVTKDLLIKDISSNFKNYLLGKNDILLSKEYEVIVKDGKTASQVFLELEKIGISNVSIDKLDNSNIIEYRKEAKINAVKAARDKAEALATAINQNIGRALYIREVDNSSNASMYSNSLNIRGAFGPNVYTPTPEMNFDFEKIRIEYSILCRFELK
jgi:hypothetical protein